MIDSFGHSNSQPHLFSEMGFNNNLIYEFGNFARIRCLFFSSNQLGWKESPNLETDIGIELKFNLLIENVPPEEIDKV